jgi:hypothetical protein
LRNVGTNPANQDNLSLQQQYGDRYNEIVRPDRVFAVSHYMRTRWAPLLGAARFWFVVALRQRCYWNDRRDWFVADKKTLARESGLSLRTVNRIIAAVDHPPDEETRDSLAAWFFDKTRRRRYRQQVGRTVNAPNRYHVLLDDPLTPADQHALDEYLAHTQSRNQSDSSPEGTLALLQELCTHTAVQLYEILSLDQEPEQDLPVCNSLFTFDVVAERCPMPDPKDPLYAQIARAASELHNKLTRPEHVYVGNQYFRLHWLPTLGPVLSSLVLNLRARCYWDKKSGELRDTCTASWADLAREIGCTTRQLRNLRTHPDLERFVTTLDSGHTFKVQLPDPLIEADRERFAQEADQIVDPETGQAGFVELLAPKKTQRPELLADRSPEKAEEMARTAPGTDSDPELLAPGNRKFWHIEGLEAEVLAHTPGNSGTIIKVQITTPTLKGLRATALDLTPELQRDEEKLAAAARTHLLNALGIQPPGLGKILAQNPRCDTIAAWGIYALTQAGLTDNRAGYLYRRLVDGDPAPRDMLTLASLPMADWQALEAAHQESLFYHTTIEANVSAYGLWHIHLSSVWDTLDVNLGDESEQSVSETVAPPKALSDLMTDREELTPASLGWEVITKDLYRAHQLLTADRTGWEDVPVKVNFTDGAWLYALPAEWLTLRITPFTAEQWRAVQQELEMVISQRVFNQHWRRVVAPLGICAPDRVLLGVSLGDERDWLEAWQKENVERILCGVLGREVQVEFWTYCDAGDPVAEVPLVSDPGGSRE